MGKPWEIIVGDVRRVLRDMEPNSFSAALSDPPYGLSFMGNRWDYSIPSANVWSELLRVLKPGAYAMLFGGTRTFHRLMVAVEDAGFLPCDTCMWMHGKGFPKSLDVSKAIDKRLGAKRTNVVGHKNAGLDRGSGASVDFQGSKGRDETGLIPVTTPAPSQASLWDGYGTALKPAWEPIMLACKPQDGTYAENALRHGCGALDIDASRIGSEVPHLAPAGNDGTSPASIAPVNVTGYEGKTVVGRWPANVVLSHDARCVHVGTKRVKGTEPAGPRRTGRSTSFSRGVMNGGIINSRKAGVEEVDAWECAPGCPVRVLDEQAGDCPGMSGGGSHRPGYEGGMFGGIDAPHLARADGGGPSRFYYVTKASRAERERGMLDNLEIVIIEAVWGSEVRRARLRVGTGSSVIEVTDASGTLSNSASEWNTWLSGSGPTDQSLRGCKSITRIETRSTTDSKTLSCLLPLLTSGSTRVASGETASSGSPAAVARRSTPSLTITCGETGLFIPGVGHVRSPTQLRISGNAESPADHPTVKPLDLCRYFARLLLPPPRADGKPRRIVVPYSGSGSEMIGCLQAGWDEVVGIELNPKHAEKARLRISKGKIFQNSK